jgi:pimeloyl-ACP methyl ester carboxylesterase
VTPIIFIHGAGLEASFWRYQTSFFADSVAVDLPGHGASPLETLGSIPDYATWVIDWARELHPGPVVLVGHSMGSLVALEAAAANPDFVERLVLVATTADVAINPKLLAATQQRDPAAAAMLSEWNLPADGGFGRPKDWAEEIGRGFVEAVASGLIADDLLACDVYDQAVAKADKVECPTLLILGERDKMTKPQAAQPLAAALTDARIVMVNRAGHLIPLEQPAAVNDAITLFLTTT